MKQFSTRSLLCVSAAVCAFNIASATPACAADAAPAAPADSIENRDDIVVTATKVNRAAPITSSVHTVQPQSIISRSIIENSVPPTADFSDIILLTPGASGTSNGNGPGLSESKTVLRGFQDGQYNITWDGIPFGDSNDPTHHSTAYFPDGTYERIIVDRGPGAATDLGQASYGGNVHIISRDPDNKAGVEALADYGSYNSWLGRLALNSGSIAKLGGLKLIGVGEYKKTDGALSASNAWFYNMYGKAELPLGERAKFTLSAAYNQDFYHQSDNNGVSCTGAVKATSTAQTTTAAYAITGAYPQTNGSNCIAGSQVATYGKRFGLVDPSSATFAGTPWPSARSDWNWTRKATDFEVARLTWNITNNITFDNKAYTYFYKNFTLSSQTSTQPCAVGASGTLLVQTATQCSGFKNAIGSFGTSTFLSAGTVATGPVLQNNPNDISGYNKVNQYRQIGNIAQIDVKTSFGIGKIGFWYEHSASHRYGYTVDLTQAAAAGAIGDGSFNFQTAPAYYDYAQFKYDTTKKELDGTVTPAYLRYDERTGWEQYQGYGEFEFKFLDNKLTITPGVKVQNFTRKIYTALVAQSSRVGINSSASYKPTLPYASVNYLIQPNFSIYAQYAKGFLVPSLGISLESVAPNAAGGLTGSQGQPTKTTNYQAGLVYAGDRLNIDVDGYYIQASSATTVDPSSGNASQSGESVTYQGTEGQISYVVIKGLTAIANASLNTAKGDITHLWLAQAPNYTALLGAVYNNGPIKLSYLHKFTGRQFADSPAFTAATLTTPNLTTAGQAVRIAPYSNGTFVGSYTFRNFTLGVSVYDVFNDTSTTKIGSSTKATPLYFFQPGRSYQVQVKAKF